MSPLETLTAGWYNLFYTLAVGVAGWMMFDAGRRRGWASGTWSFAVAAWIAGGVIGSMLPHAIFGDVVAERTMVGAVIMATVVVTVVARALGRDSRLVLDATAVAIPVGAAIVRIGCFLAECCQGVLTSLPLGVALHAEDAPRHAAQLYEAFLAAVLALVIAGRARDARPGVAFLGSAGGMCAIRFTIEFVRDNEKYSGLSLAQWVLLPVGVFCLFVLLARRPERRQPRALTTPTRRGVLAVVGILAIGALISGLPALETTVLLAGGALLLAVAARRLCAPAPAGLAAMMLQLPVAAPDSTYPRIFTTFGGGVTMGSWEAAHRYTNCDGDVVEQWSRQHRAIGSTFEVGTRTQISRHRGIGVRVRGYADVDNASRAKVTRGTATETAPYTQHSYGVSFAADGDWKYFGLTLGISGGRFYPMLEDGGGGGSPIKPLPLFPAFGLRIGRLDGFSFETRLGDEVPMWVPAPIGSVAIAFGDSTGNRLRLGGTEAGFLIAGRVVRPGLEILPTVVIGGSPGSDGSHVASAIQGGLMFRKWIDIKRR